jgi:hypothetical protein
MKQACPHADFIRWSVSKLPLFDPPGKERGSLLLCGARACACTSYALPPERKPKALQVPEGNLNT